MGKKKHNCKITACCAVDDEFAQECSKVCDAIHPSVKDIQEFELEGYDRNKFLEVLLYATARSPSAIAEQFKALEAAKSQVS